MRARKARASDAPEIFGLIARYAAQGFLLPRGEEEIRRNISHFLVLEEKGRLLSCVGLESYGADLTEIRSLAVARDLQGRGLGAKLIEYALEEARRREIARVFAVTHAPKFFLRQGFATVSRQTLTEKIERDCHGCAKRRSCRLTAVVATLLPERDAFPILSGSSVSAAAQ
ncbi:MAG TPA: GNAT family N-acetyltransferase [Candidatus Limnocylindrales bacterium]|jgi:amino-acid N-acetyltransferase|nr:GNAT family N-acetyltransferase [Candidatus Limnocylindrales bacterium]